MNEERLSLKQTNWENLPEKLSLRRKLIGMSLLLSLTICLVLGGYSFYVTRSSTLENTIDQTGIILEQTAKSMDYAVSEISHVSDMIFSNKTILRTIAKEEVSLSDEKMINELLQQYVINSDIYNIYLITDGGRVFSYGPRMKLDLQNSANRDWYEETSKRNGGQYWLAIRDNSLTGTDSMMISNIRMLKDLEIGSTIGIMIINSNEKILRHAFKDMELSPGSRMCLVDRNGFVISDTEAGRIGEDISKETFYQDIDGEQTGHLYCGTGQDRSLLEWTEVGQINCKLLLFIPYRNLIRPVNKILTMTILIIAAVLALAFLYNVYLSGRITRPIRELEQYMEKVQDGTFDIQISRKPREAELAGLFDRFHYMVSRIRILTEDLKRTDEKKREAEILALQAQINPHFLYNTLETVNSLAKLNGVGKISEVVIALSRLLRTSIGTKEELITLETEENYLRSYLEIIQARNSEPITVEILIDPVIKKCLIVKLILQPLVENALTHGIELSSRPGKIRILAEEENSHLRISVEDNGIGMTEEELACVTEKLAAEAETEQESGHYGLRNTNERLILHYGKQAALHIESRHKEGTKVWFIIPKQEHGK